MMHDSALAFIDRNKANPFFLYIPTIIPHAELLPPDSLTKKQVGQFGKEQPYKGIKTVKFATRYGAYNAQVNPKAAFVAMMELLDQQIGEIVSKLKTEGIYDNTIILFTSDNGPHKEGGAQPDFFNSNGGLRGYKRDLYEGGIRVPLIIHWPKKIKAGKTNILSAAWDIMPTLTEIIHSGLPNETDGISLCPTLLSSSSVQLQHPYLYWEFHEEGGKQAVRMGKWKAVRLYVNHHPLKTKIELYDLETDVTESKDVSSEHPDIVLQLQKIMETAHTPSKSFHFKK